MTPQQQPTNPQGPAPGGPRDPAKPPAQDPRPGDTPQDHRAPGDKHPTPKLGTTSPASVAEPDRPTPAGGPAESPVPPTPTPAPPAPGPAPDGP